MSYYYNYTLGYMKDGKIYPFGPFDRNGKLKDAVWVSRSFASDLHEDFDVVKEEQISDELRKAMQYEGWDNEMHMPEVKWLALDDLPKGSFIKTGYFLQEDITAYLRGKDSDLFFESMTPLEYAIRLETEMKFGKPPVIRDYEGTPIEERSCSEYAYFCYPDYNCKEYEAFRIREAAEILEDYSLTSNGAKIVVLETEG